jgi:Flagellar hook-length control protein FliK
MIDAKVLAGYARLRGLDALVTRDPAAPRGTEAPTDGATARPAQSAPATLAAASLAPLLLRSGNAGDSSPTFTGAARLAASLPRAEAADIAPQSALDVGRAASSDVATRLRDDVQLSGLFYESHLADWVAGSRDTAALRREPQAAWQAPQPDPPEAKAARKPAHAGTANAPANTAGTPRDMTAPHLTSPAASDAAGPRNVDVATLAAASTTTPAPGIEAAAGTGAQSTDTPLLPPEARDMVAQQLAVLEQRRVAWSGEAWPGQGVAIAFEEDAAAQGASAPQRAWIVRLDTTLPELGRMASTLRLQGGALTVDIAADDPRALERLQAARAAFDAALAAAGIGSADIRLERHAP